MVKRVIRKQAILEEMKALAAVEKPKDTEYWHSRADELLCDALVLHGEQELVDLWNKVKKYYA